VSELSGLTRRLLLEELAIIVVDLQGPARVAIDGRDAAGKTVLADELAPVVEAHG
jgi:hypothetical protein